MTKETGIILTSLTPDQARQINAYAREVRLGQARLDAYIKREYIKRQNRFHLVAYRWLRQCLIRLCN
jgi:hypothetical protein